MSCDGSHCSGCTNQVAGQSIIYPDGDGSSGIMLLGDSPWKSEQYYHKNFAGAAGFYLENNILGPLGINRKGLTVANSMWCSPPHLGWTDHITQFPEAIAALNHCSPYLEELVLQRRPKVIVAMGGVAMGRSLGLYAKDSKYNVIEQKHAYVHESGVLHNLPVIVSYHPSAIMQQKHKLTPCLRFAMRRAQEIADGSYRPTPMQLVRDPSPGDAMAYLRSHLLLHHNRIDLLMVDIETPESARMDEEDLEEAGVSYQIERAGFSCCEGHGISFPWNDEYKVVLQEAISHASVVAEWADNHFDSRRLRAAGIDFGRARILSGMWAWHFLQSDLLKGLGFVSPFFYAGPSFKHMASTSPALYNAMDNAVGRMCTVGSLDGLRAEGRLDRFMRHCVDADQILVRMGSAGINIDRGKQAAFMGRMQTELNATMVTIQAQVPESVKKVVEWKTRPANLDEDGYAEVVSGHHKDEAIKVRVKVEYRAETIKGHKPLLCYATLPFNINSSDQKIELIKSFGLKVPKKRGGGDDASQTTEAKHLRRFARKYPVFHNILIASQRGKLLSTYNWPLDANDCIKTTFGYHPSTLRKSSRNVNVQNIPKRSELADEFRRMIIAPPGYYWVTSDASAIEAVLVGYDAGSERYIRLSKAGLHGWMTSAYHKEVIPIELPFAELVKRCKAAKKKWPVDYEVLKRVDHLSNYMGTPERIFEEYPDEFESLQQAAEMQRFYLTSEPGQDVVKWWTQVADKCCAHRPNYLINHFGYKHYFYGMKKYEKGVWKPGDDLKRAVAFGPQSDGSAIQTEVLLRMAEGYEGVLDRLRLIIHDEIASLVKEDDVEDHATIQHTEMIRPIPELPMADGSCLSIGAETKYGRNLASYHPEMNPEGMREMVVDEVAA